MLPVMFNLILNVTNDAGKIGLRDRVDTKAILPIESDRRPDFFIDTMSAKAL